MTHCEPVANAYRRNDYGRAAACVNARFDGVRYAVEVNVPRHYLGLCRHYGYERLGYLLVGQAQGFEKRTLRRFFHARTEFL
jgi:hypothetical protein